MQTKTLIRGIPPHHSEDMDIVKSVVDANGIGYLADILEQHGGYDIRQGVSISQQPGSGLNNDSNNSI